MHIASKFIGFCAMLLLLSLFLSSPPAAAQTSPNPPGTGPVTNCSTGCTIITCNATMCTVNYCDYSGCRVVGHYNRPKSDALQAHPVAKTANGSASGTLSASDASLQFAMACSEAAHDCRMYAVKPDGATYIGNYRP
ncbi:hypothetical protein [Thermomonas sp.]|uniref:hypothetical protein n=1 Tax=Thermomonas sp. TaxID=1971895 RepID=UPI0037852C32